MRSLTASLVAVATAGLALGFAGCGSDGGKGTPTTNVPTPTINAEGVSDCPSIRRAVSDAHERAGYIMQSGAVQQILVNPPSCLEDANVRPAQGFEDKWTVTLRGLFYAPEGPPVPDTSTRPPRRAACSQITVEVERWTYEPGNLTFQVAAGC